MTIDDTPTNLIEGEEDGATWLVQNLGPDDLYLARNEADATITEGVRVAANEALSFGPVRSYNGGAGIWCVCDEGDEADARVLRIG